ncbi:hypothetical protein HAX54_024233, partial [Datura stramonium]|nr:hypothetical protein [Datura stramonium]
IFKTKMMEELNLRRSYRETVTCVPQSRHVSSRWHAGRAESLLEMVYVPQVGSAICKCYMKK